MNTSSLIHEILEEKKAQHILVLNMGSSALHEHIIICETSNLRHLFALRDDVLEALKIHKIEVHHTEGKKNSHWLLIDVYDVCCHIFLDEARDYYQLETLWADKVMR